MVATPKGRRECTARIPQALCVECGYIDARELANLKPVYHGQNGVRMLRELARSYLTIVQNLSRGQIVEV